MIFLYIYLAGWIILPLVNLIYSRLAWAEKYGSLDKYGGFKHTYIYEYLDIVPGDEPLFAFWILAWPITILFLIAHLISELFNVTINKSVKKRKKFISILELQKLVNKIPPRNSDLLIPTKTLGDLREMAENTTL